MARILLSSYSSTSIAQGHNHSVMRQPCKFKHEAYLSCESPAYGSATTWYAPSRTPASVSTGHTACSRVYQASQSPHYPPTSERPSKTIRRKGNLPRQSITASPSNLSTTELHLRAGKAARLLYTVRPRHATTNQCVELSQACARTPRLRLLARVSICLFDPGPSTRSAAGRRMLM